jgi:hypothetical protein
MIPFTTLSRDAIATLDNIFTRVFAGRTQSTDIADLAKHYRCSVIVLTPEDGAWQHDELAQSALYALVDQTPAWKIYRARN